MPFSPQNNKNKIKHETITYDLRYKENPNCNKMRWSGLMKQLLGVHQISFNWFRLLSYKPLV
jgi:hypothetical protein